MLVVEEYPETGLGWYLDKLCVLLESWKLLLGATVGALVVAVAVVFVLPGKYRSEAILPLTPKTKAAFLTDSFFDAVVKDSFLLVEAGGNIEVARRRLRGGLGRPAETDRDSGLFRIVLHESTPARAQDLLQKIVAQLLIESRPVGSLLASTVQQIEALEASIPELEKLSGQIAQNVRRVQDGLEGEQFARAIATLYGDITQKRLKVIELRRALAGTHPDDVVQRPTLGERDGSRSLVVLIAVAGALALAAVFVFARDVLRRARITPELAPTIERMSRVLDPKGAKTPTTAAGSRETASTPASRIAAS